MKKVIIIGILALCVLGYIIYSYSQPASLSVDIAGTSTDAVVQGANDSLTFSAGETGVLRIKDGNLLFFDYKSRKDYVICSRANCRHNDDSCSGWYEGYRGALGLAEYGEKLYCLISNSEKNVYELVQMNLDGNHRKVITEIDRGDGAPGKWEADLKLSSPYYAGHKVITILNWHYNPADSDEEDIQTQQCIAVDLQSGEITEVTPRQKEPVQCFIEAVSKNHSAIEVCGYQEQPLTQREFYEQYEQGAFAKNDRIMKAKDPYEGYQDWYFDETPQWYRYLLFDLKQEDTSIIKKGFLKKVRNEDGEVRAFVPPFYISGLYEDDLITEEIEEEMIEDEGYLGFVKNRVYRWDLKKDQKELLLDLENGYVFDAGGVDVSSIIEGDTLLFLKRKPNGKADYYRYSLKTGKEELLYEAERNVPYRIVGETKRSFLYYTADDTKKSMYMMDKEDYYKGDFEGSVRLKELDEYF